MMDMLRHAKNGHFQPLASELLLPLVFFRKQSECLHLGKCKFLLTPTRVLMWLTLQVIFWNTWVTNSAKAVNEVVLPKPWPSCLREGSHKTSKKSSFFMSHVDSTSFEGTAWKILRCMHGASNTKGDIARKRSNSQLFQILKYLSKPLNQQVKISLRAFNQSRWGKATTTPEKKGQSINWHRRFTSSPFYATKEKDRFVPHVNRMIPFSRRIALLNLHTPFIRSTVNAPVPLTKSVSKLFVHLLPCTSWRFSIRSVLFHWHSLLSLFVRNELGEFRKPYHPMKTSEMTPRFNNMGSNWGSFSRWLRSHLIGQTVVSLRLGHQAVVTINLMSLYPENGQPGLAIIVGQELDFHPFVPVRQIVFEYVRALNHLPHPKQSRTICSEFNVPLKNLNAMQQSIQFSLVRTTKWVLPSFRTDGTAIMVDQCKPQRLREKMVTIVNRTIAPNSNCLTLESSWWRNSRNISVSPRIQQKLRHFSDSMR